MFIPETKIFTALVHNSGKITIPFGQRKLLDIEDNDNVTVSILDIHKSKKLSSES